MHIVTQPRYSWKADKLGWPIKYWARRLEELDAEGWELVTTGLDPQDGLIVVLRKSYQPSERTDG